jgi:Recombinase
MDSDSCGAAVSQFGALLSSLDRLAGSTARSRCSSSPGAAREGLLAWAERTGRRRAAVPGRGGLRFVFYGRVSTEDWQDPVTSRARQIQLWTPLVGGRVDFGAEDHEQTMMALGLQSRREVTRTRIRVRTAMAAQTREQGRYLGGRPPYGYRLADAGPHPNKAHAAWGGGRTGCSLTRRRHRRCRGSSRSGALNDAAISCPSAADPGRNPHRSGTAWTLHTVRAILGNPRYTGRQVWNRQRADRDLVDPALVAWLRPSAWSGSGADHAMTLGSG